MNISKNGKNRKFQSKIFKIEYLIYFLILILNYNKK